VMTRTRGGGAAGAGAGAAAAAGVGYPLFRNLFDNLDLRGSLDTVVWLVPSSLEVAAGCQ